MNARDLLGPEFAPLAGLVPDLISEEFLAAARATPFPSPPPSGTVACTEHSVPGDPEVPVRVHRPKDAVGLLPCMYSIHGGGYITGSYDMDDALFDRVAIRIQRDLFHRQGRPATDHLHRLRQLLPQHGCAQNIVTINHRLQRGDQLLQPLPRGK